MIEPERVTSGDFLQSEPSYNLVLPHATDGARAEPQRKEPAVQSWGTSAVRRLFEVERAAGTSRTQTVGNNSTTNTGGDKCSNP